MNNIDKAKELLAQENTCVLVNGDTVYMSKLSGIKPMMDFIGRGVDLRGFSAADKVVGRAAAMLFVLGGVREVYATVLSKGGLEVLTKHNIKCSFDKLSDVIVNRAGTGICPMEQTVENIDDADKAYEMLRQKIAATRGV